MKNFKVTGKTIFLNVSVPVEIGQIKLDHIYQISVYRAKEKGKVLYDIDDVDYQNISYMGMKVEGYQGFRKLREFHKELGIDLDQLVREEASKQLTPDELERWLNDTYKDSFGEIR
jgi:hypothetical protein